MTDPSDAPWIVALVWLAGCLFGYLGGRRRGYQHGADDALQLLRKLLRDAGWFNG